jgi:HK97 family phage prohead protease
MTDMERRIFPLAGAFRLELRGEKQVIEGHAAVFGQKTQIWGFTEEVAPGAFAESIAKDDVRALINHNPDLVLGRNKSGTLRLSEDAAGLLTEIEPPDTQPARDLLVLLKRGDISQMSFGFRTLDDAWSSVDGMPHRTLKRVQLFDVSPVTFPAYPQTDAGVAMRSLAEWKKARPDHLDEAVEKAAGMMVANARERELQLKR